MTASRLTVAITGMNAVPDNPGAGLAVARGLREAPGRGIRIVGLGYDALDPGLHRREYCDSVHLLSYPGSGAQALMARLAEIHEAEPSMGCCPASIPNCPCWSVCPRIWPSAACPPISPAPSSLR